MLFRSERWSNGECSYEEKMIRIFVLVVLVFLGEIIKIPKTYREEEITEMLCKKILKKKNLDDQFVNIIDMQKTENSILVGYVIGNTEQIKSPGYLIFKRDKEKYILNKNQSLMSERGFEIYTSIFSEPLDNGVIDYLVILNMNEALKEIVITDDENDKKVWQIHKIPCMCVVKYPKNGCYLLL